MSLFRSSCLKVFWKIYRKTNMLESLFDKATCLRPITLLERVSNTGVFLWIIQSFWQNIWCRISVNSSFWLFVKSSEWLKAVNYFDRKLHLRYFSGFWICLCILIYCYNIDVSTLHLILENVPWIHIHLYHFLNCYFHLTFFNYEAVWWFWLLKTARITKHLWYYDFKILQ